MTDDVNGDLESDGVIYDFQEEPAAIEDTVDDPEKNEPAKQPEGQEERPKSNWVDFEKPLDDQKEMVKARIDELTREAYKAKRLQAEIEQLKANKPKQEIKPVEPPSEDLFFDNPEEFKKQSLAYARHEQQLEMQRERDEEDQRKSKELQDSKQNQRLSDFMARAATQSVKEDVIAKAAKLSIDIGIKPDVIDVIVDDDQGPLILAKLNSDIDAMVKLAEMTPLQAVRFIEREIRPSLSSAKKESAPPPPTKVNGARIAEHSDDGTTYE